MEVGTENPKVKRSEVFMKYTIIMMLFFSGGAGGRADCQTDEFIIESLDQF